MSISKREWFPNEHQLKFLEVMKEASFTMSITEAASQAGVERTAYYRWADRPEFVAWYRQEALRWATLQTSDVVKAIIDGARGEGKGNPASQKLFLELCVPEYAPRSRVDNTGAQGFTIVVGQLESRKPVSIDGTVIDVEPVPQLARSEDGNE